MYEPERDPRIGGPDSPVETDAKRSIIGAFDEMRTTGNPNHAPLCKVVEDGLLILDREMHRKSEEYKKGHVGGTGEVSTWG